MGLKKLLRAIRNKYYFVHNYFIFILNKIEIKGRFKIKGIIYIKNKGTISIGDNFLANSGFRHNPIGGDIILRFIVRKNAVLRIGNNFGISNSTIFCTTSIRIGDNVIIGGGCKIWDTDFHSINSLNRIFGGDNLVSSKPIKINDNVFIGGGSILLKGVEIGENSIIGAGSVVTKSIPKNEIWAGNPAKFIKAIKA